MAERITKLVPSIKKVRMCNSGTEATMSAIRLARGFTGRDKIIKFAGCYHGHSDSLLIKAGSGALTHGHPDSSGVPASFARETIVLPFNDRDAVRAAFAANPAAIAGIILEPYPANVGLIRPDAGYLDFLREITTQQEALLIFDEVMTGFRLARGGVQEIEKITPDLTTLGKIIGGGLPLKLLEDDSVYERLERMGAQIQQAVSTALSAKGLPSQVPQTGSMWCTYFTDTPVRDLTSAQTTDANIFGAYFQAALKRGVYLPPSAFEACFISTAHDGSAINQACEILTDVIQSL